MQRVLFLTLILFFISCSNMLGDFHGPKFSGDWEIEYDETISEDYLSDEVTISWPTATDESHSSGNITYKIYVTEDPNDPLTSSCLVGSVKGETTITLPKTENGLAGYVTIVAIDPKGNKTVFESSPISLNLELLNEFDEDNKFLPRPDTLPPTPGAGSDDSETSAEITVTSKDSTSVGIKWNEATDNKSDSSDLEYLVVISKSENITTVENAEKNGTVKMDWTKNVESVDLTGLEPNTTYWYNVIVKDSTGNKAVYDYGKITTDEAADSTDPTPGGTGNAEDKEITATPKSPTEVGLQWKKSGDDTTGETDIEYKVVISKYENITTVENAEMNGTVKMDWTKNIESVDLTDLEPNTTYWYNVIVKDSAGNKAVYDYGKITTDKVAPGSINVDITLKPIDDLNISFVDSSDVTISGIPTYVKSSSITIKVPSSVGNVITWMVDNDNLSPLPAGITINSNTIIIDMNAYSIDKSIDVHRITVVVNDMNTNIPFSKQLLFRISE